MSKYDLINSKINILVDQRKTIDEQIKVLSHTLYLGYIQDFEIILRNKYPNVEVIVEYDNENEYYDLKVSGESVDSHFIGVAIRENLYDKGFYCFGIKCESKEDPRVPRCYVSMSGC